MRTHPLLFAGLSLLVVLTLGACTDGPQDVGEPAAVAVPTTTPEPVVEAAPIVQADAEGREEPVVAIAGDPGVAGIDNGVMLATRLLEIDVDNLAGEDFGEVDDLLVDLTSGNVLYASVSHGGFLNIGESQVMVPLAALQWNAVEEAFIITTSGAELFDAWPDLADGWPDTRDPAWDDEVIQFWDNAGVNTPWDPAAERTQVAWVSQLLDGELSLAADSRAEIENVLINLSQSRVRYVLLAEDEGLFDDTNWHALPYHALASFASPEGRLVFTPAVDMDTLAGAPSIAPDTLASGVVFDESWDDELDTYWQQAGYAAGGAAAAAGAAAGSGEEAPRAGSAGVAGADNVMMLASRLLDTDVANTADEGLGDISDLYIDASTGNVLFATLAHGGFLNIGEENLPVPLSALEWNFEEEKLILPMREEVLASFPDIEEGWENTFDPGWIVVSAFWRDAGYGSPLLEQEVEPQLVLLASSLIGYRFGTFQAPALGNVRDLIVDLENSKIQYVVLSLADADIFGQEWRIVPFAAFDPAAFGDELVFPQEFNADLLRDAPRIAEGSLGDLDTIHPGWDDEIAAYWAGAGYEVGE
jgi:sporulation protein YlmC with PRC-barrel domain